MKEAPLFELDDFRCPGEAYYFSLNEKGDTRVAIWNLESSKGSIIL